MEHRVVLAVWLFLWLTSASAVAQTREEKVLADRSKFAASKTWIYNDVAQGFAEAKRSGKPLLVTLRCIPCDECVKLDDEVVEGDRRLQHLLEQFVLVRQISANGLDLSLFQFDTDQSYAAFIFNADGTIYGRYGTRSDRVQHADDVSIAGLAQALEGSLELHRDFPSHRPSLLAKRGQPPQFKAPELYPALRDKYGKQLDYAGNVVTSCIHCHQVGEAEREFYLSQGGIPDEVLLPYPHPKVIGLILDPNKRASVLRIDAGSPAALAGILPGDEIVQLAGQPLLSMADVQWVLHHVPATGGKVTAKIHRDRQPTTAILELPNGWRQQDDISWRASTWQLRRVAIGGMVLKANPTETNAEQGQNKPRLQISHVGQYAPHDRAKKAGLQAGDLLLSFDGSTDFVRETDLLVHALRREKKPLPVEIIRAGQRKSFVIQPE